MKEVERFLRANIFVLAIFGAEKMKESPPAASANGKVSTLQWAKVYKLGSMRYLGVVYFFDGLSYIVYAVVKVEFGFFLLSQEACRVIWKNVQTIP